MAIYTGFLEKATTSTTVGAASLEAPGSSMRRFRLLEYSLSSATSPAADNTFQVKILRTSTASTGTSSTPSPADPADAACVTLAREEITVEGTTGVRLDSVAFNGRLTYRWQARHGSELVVPATANAGMIFTTPVAANTPKITIGYKFDE